MWRPGQILNQADLVGHSQKELRATPFLPPGPVSPGTAPQMQGRAGPGETQSWFPMTTAHLPAVCPQGRSAISLSPSLLLHPFYKVIVSITRGHVCQVPSAWSVVGMW